ncbi:MAG TPA: 3-hydroxyacyl-CoA dehydrogenase family protein [Gemmatimonadales bacterium]|nr:3-hydroxyacyl-CoA dehydrogenase family protein [Gemmatimonadales bacterium]
MIVGVAGSGLMGSGIAQATAVAGHRTLLRDTAPAQLDKAHAAIRKSLAKLVEKGKLIGEAAEAAQGRIELTTELGALFDADLVIEAIPEDLALKNTFWGELDRGARSEVIFASNTSSLSIIDMASATSRPDRFLGLHFFNPVPLMPLVEVVRSVATSDASFEFGMRFVRGIGKEPVASRDTSGFIVNLLLVPYILDGIRALENGVASIPDLDLAMRLGAGHPMGPLTLADFVGLDTLARSGEIMFQEYRESRYAAPPLLKRMVAAGYLGRKSGRGFYDYRHDPPVPSTLGL